MSRKFIFCFNCGKIELSERNYNYQMDHAEIGWFCPVCGDMANWDGEYDPCPNCDSLVSHDVEDCPNCGENQEALYYGGLGNA